jgi:hypothetical protein
MYVWDVDVNVVGLFHPTNSYSTFSTCPSPARACRPLINEPKTEHRRTDNRLIEF